MGCEACNPKQVRLGSLPRSRNLEGLCLRSGVESKTQVTGSDGWISDHWHCMIVNFDMSMPVFRHQPTLLRGVSVASSSSATTDRCDGGVWAVWEWGE
jgi:hypothetical protein